MGYSAQNKRASLGQGLAGHLTIQEAQGKGPKHPTHHSP